MNCHAKWLMGSVSGRLAYSSRSKSASSAVMPQRLSIEVPLAVKRLQNLGFGVTVDALVHPRFFEFVRGHHAIPVLVAEFVLGDQFHAEQALGHPPGCSAGDEGGILHPAGIQRALGRIHQRDAVVGIRSVPLVEAIQGALDHLEVAADGTFVPGRKQQVDMHRARRARPGVFNQLVVGRGRPGEVVDILGVPGDRLGLIGIGNNETKSPVEPTM